MSTHFGTKGNATRWWRRLAAIAALATVSLFVFAGSVTRANALEPSYVYAPVDLGPGAAEAVAENGQVVGIVGGDFHAFSWTQDGGMVNLGTLGGYSNAFAVNENGQVVGGSGGHAFSWTEAAGMLDLGTLGGSWSVAQDVNNAGQVAGASQKSDGSEGAFIWSQGGAMIDLGTLGSDTWPVAIDETGRVVGVSWSFGYRAFSWAEAGGMINLGGLGINSESMPTAVNNNGQIVGSSGLVPGPSYAVPWHAFSWTEGGGMVDLGTLGGSSSSAADVNNAGQVVGTSATPGDASDHAFRWTQAGGMTDLGTLGGSRSFAAAISEAGQVIGGSTTSDETLHAFSWTQAGGMVDLGASTYAYGVNSSGLIVGSTLTANGDTNATVWLPQPALVFHGFFPPVDNDGVFNVVNAGRTVPVKFDLNGDEGLNIFASGYPGSVPIDCGSGAPQDVIEQTVGEEESRLLYDGTVNAPIGQYTYQWRTDRAWAGTCRQVQLKLYDGQVFTANFRFR